MTLTKLTSFSANNGWAHAALLGTNVFFAINLSAVKYLTGHKWIGPFGLNIIRVGVSVILFWLLFLFSGKKLTLPQKTDIPRLILCSLTGITINQLLFLKGLSMTFPIHAVLLMLTTPILITFISAWLLKELLDFRKLAGLALGVSGAIILITAKEMAVSGGEQIVAGDILVIINAISYSFYFILVKPLMSRYKPLEAIRWIFTFGLFFMLPFGWKEFTEVRWAAIDANGLICMALVVIAGTFLAYLFNVYGISRLGAGTAGMYIYLQPFFASAIAMFFLGEKLTAYKILAALLIFSGIYLSGYAAKKSKDRRREITLR